MCTSANGYFRNSIFLLLNNFDNMYVYRCVFIFLLVEIFALKLSIAARSCLYILFRWKLLVVVCILYALQEDLDVSRYLLVFFFFFFGAPRSISYFIYTLSGCDGENRTRNIAVYTWRLSLLSYGRRPGTGDGGRYLHVRGSI